MDFCSGNGLSLGVTFDQDYQPSTRLVTGTGSMQGLAYGFDAVGNRTSQSGGSTNLAETYGYAANSNQLQSVVNGATTRSLSYTPTGNLASDDRGTGTVLGFTYDLSNRMVQVANQNQPLATYAYNFLDQRAAKTTSSSITHFLYDRADRLLAEINGADGAAQTEYVWLDDMPLALVTGGTLYLIHPDHLNTPQKATDGAQTLAWDAVLRPFGQAEQQTFPPLTNLRFPGQYLDTESGLHQNGFRDYDPTLGRYIESDPIGLDGGTNTYAYAAGNPIAKIDPLGLADTTDNSFSWGDLIPPHDPFGTLFGALFGFPAKKSGRWTCNAKCYSFPATCPAPNCAPTFGYGVGPSLPVAMEAAEKQARNATPVGCRSRHCAGRCTSPRGDHIYVNAA